MQQNIVILKKTSYAQMVSLQRMPHLVNFGLQTRDTHDTKFLKNVTNGVEIWDTCRHLRVLAPGIKICPLEGVCGNITFHDCNNNMYCLFCCVVLQ